MISVTHFVLYCQNHQSLYHIISKPYTSHGQMDSPLLLVISRQINTRQTPVTQTSVLMSGVEPGVSDTPIQVNWLHLNHALLQYPC